jgi:hypothetical protein
MGNATQRTIARWIHIALGLPLIGFVYGPPAEVEPYRYLFQLLFMPALLLSGLWMWKGHLISARFGRQKSFD